MAVAERITESYDAKSLPLLVRLCPVGEPMSVEWKGGKYPTIFRGAKGHVYVLSQSSSGSGKGKFEIATPGYLLIDIPVVGGKQVQFEYHSSHTVKFLSDGVVYGFNTFSARVHSRPSVIVLEYPASIEKYPLRKHERVETLVPVVIAEDGAGKKDEGAMINISSSGTAVAVESCNGYGIGQKVALSCTLPDGNGMADVHASIKSIKPSGEKFIMGLSFSDVEHPSVDAVRRFYRECIQYVEK